jgi:carbon-monoxide dehydrogenase small subunit
MSLHEESSGDRVALDLIVNGQAVHAWVEPRTHLADFLREHLHLTGTHLGCEHGVCGACTVLIDGEPSRSCITFAANCMARDVRTIEGLEHDPATAALRAAFTADHGLQCGFCTPGMVITARDIVLNLPEADDDRIRLELAGNLCRCTGYNGIVRAIRRVLDQALPLTRSERPALATIAFAPVQESKADPALPDLSTSPPPPPRAQELGLGTPALRQSLDIGLPRSVVWAALCDPALVAGCVPGAALTEAVDGRLAGVLTVALGPVQGRFTGTGSISYDMDAFTGALSGEGRDQISHSRLSAQAVFALVDMGPQATRMDVTVTYALRGPLAQFGRGPIVQVFAKEIAAQVGRNLEARVKGEAAPIAAPSLQAGDLIIKVLRQWLKRVLGR